MTQRKYSLAEIDRMRSVIGSQVGPFRNDGAVEERLRTYMLNGTDPLELEIADRERRIAHWRIKVITYGMGEMRLGIRTYFPLVELRKHVFKLEEIKARNGL